MKLSYKPFIPKVCLETNVHTSHLPSVFFTSSYSNLHRGIVAKKCALDAGPFLTRTLNPKPNKKSFKGKNKKHT